jgi:hypothetical protein
MQNSDPTGCCALRSRPARTCSQPHSSMPTSRQRPPCRGGSGSIGAAGREHARRARALSGRAGRRATRRRSWLARASRRAGTYASKRPVVHGERLARRSAGSRSQDTDERSRRSRPRASSLLIADEGWAPRAPARGAGVPAGRAVCIVSDGGSGVGRSLLERLIAASPRLSSGFRSSG